MNKPLIFLSHAGRDKELADAFRTLLVMGLNLRQSDIFYTSSKSGGIPTGNDFNSYMQRRLEDSKLVISLVTHGFYESAYCMCELGYQSAIEGVDVFPVIFDGIDPNDLSDLVYEPMKHRISHNDCLNRFADMAKKHVPNFDNVAWHENVQVFIKQYEKFRDKTYQKSIIPKRKWDNWSIVRNNVQSVLRLDDEFKLFGYKFTGFRRINHLLVFTFNEDDAIIVNICRTGNYSKQSDNFKIQIESKRNVSIKGKITVYAPPPGFETGNIVDKDIVIPIPYRFIDWFSDTNGTERVSLAFREVMEEIINGR